MQDLDYSIKDIRFIQTVLIRLFLLIISRTNKTHLGPNNILITLLLRIINLSNFSLRTNLAGSDRCQIVK